MADEPVIAEAVMTIAATKVPAVTAALEQAMSDAVADCYAKGRIEPEYIKAKMMEARRDTLLSLGWPVQE